MADYPLRDVPDDLWRQVKMLAASKGKTIRELILQLLRDAVKRG